MTDIHSHCLPGIDDGAKNTDESLALLRDAFSQGVTLTVATPHCRLHHENSVQHFLERREAAFSQIKDAAGIPEILLGAEVMVDHDISREKDIEKLCIADTNFMLTEFSRLGMSAGENEFEYLYNLSLKGINPILAHLDRYPNPEKIMMRLSDVDIIYQLNADSFLSFSGRKIIGKIMNFGGNFIVSSDMHSVSHRPCRMKKAHDKAKKMYPQSAEKMFSLNARKLFR